MSFILVKLLLVVLLTHALRWIALLIGPRWGGLALGMPCLSALALVGCEREYGLAFALIMADHCFLGVAGAVAVPVAFCQAVRWRRSFTICILGSILAYFSVASLATQLASWLPGGSALVCLSSIAITSAWAHQVRLPATARSTIAPNASETNHNWLRLVVPIVCTLGVMLASRLSGPEASGLVGMFPGLGLTFLILTARESGPTEVLRVARSLPVATWEP